MGGHALIYTWFKNAKSFLQKKEKGIFFYLLLTLMALWFIIEPIDSLKFLLRFLALIFCLSGFLEFREFSYNPHLQNYNHQKKIRSVAWMCLGVLLFLVPFFFVEWTGMLLGIFFVGFALLKLLELRKQSFDLLSVLQMSSGQHYALLLLLGLMLFFNTFLLKLAISYFLGSALLLVAVQGLWQHFSLFSMKK